jgi:hypothetical protein
VKAATWSVVTTTIAVIISLINLWFGIVRPWWRGRAASPAAQLDLLRFPSNSGWQKEERVVVTNHGPAVMEQVDVQVFDEEGTSLAIEEPDITKLWPKMPVEKLHVGQSLYLTLNLSQGSPAVRGALIKWKDGKSDEQERWVGLSYNRVT